MITLDDRADYLSSQIIQSPSNGGVHRMDSAGESWSHTVQLNAEEGRVSIPTLIN